MPNSRKTLNFTEQCNILSWKRSTRIIKSSSWPYVGQPQPCGSQCCPNASPVLSGLVLWPGKPVQCSATLWVKNVFLISNLNLPKLRQNVLICLSTEAFSWKLSPKCLSRQQWTPRDHQNNSWPNTRWHQRHRPRDLALTWSSVIPKCSTSVTLYSN